MHPDEINAKVCTALLSVLSFGSYQADLSILAGFVNFDFSRDKFSGNLGARFERDEINSIWDVGNYNGPNGARLGTLNKTYESVYPSINLKYELSENKYLRIASSITQTLPEFKELSPFEYVSPTGRVTKGNPDLEKSEIYNFDLKYEMFPERGQLFSATAFYKQINNPNVHSLKRVVTLKKVNVLSPIMIW